MLSTKSNENAIEFCIAVAVLCIAAALPLPALAKPQAATSASPATGPQQKNSAGYDDCVDHPSPDGAAINCDRLKPTPSVARPRAKRQY